MSYGKKISVIVPVYNSSHYLRSCLDSLVNQTLQEIEIILVDDNSTDNSFQILSEYQDRYPDKVCVLRNSCNLGQSASRNRGIKIASGEYIGFVDSDDYINYTMYQTMYEEAVKNNYPEIITTGICFVKDDYYLEEGFSCLRNSLSMVYHVLEHPDSVLKESPSSCNKLFRRDIIGKHLFLEGRMWEDVAFSFGKMFSADRILSCSGLNYFYRRRNHEGVSAKGYQVNSQLLDIFEVADEVEREARDSGNFSSLEEPVRFTQITVCLQRATEVMEWPIPEDDRNYLCQMLIDMVIEKYGDFRKIPIEELSARVGLLQIESLKKLSSDGSNRNLNDCTRNIESVLGKVKTLGR